MIPTLCAVILAAAPEPAPPEPGSLGAIYKAAAADLVFGVPPHRRPVTRYLSLHGIPVPERPDFVTALQLACNGVSIRGELCKLTAVGEALVRLDLEALGWDRFSREVELDKLTALGVKLNFKRERDRRFFLDIWEFMAFFEPYFAEHAHGQVTPEFAAWVGQVCGTERLVLAAHWLLPRLLIEREQGGFYSQLLIIPPVEADLYKRLGVDIKFADLDPRARRGAALPRSAQVGYNNRELQFLASDTGYDVKWLSRTLDFNSADAAEKDVREFPAGTAKHDAREILFSLANGLMGGALYNGQGTQTAIAPQNVAEDFRPSPTGDDPRTAYHSPTKTVVNYVKCMDCHGESRGLIGFNDAAEGLIAPPRLDTGYLVIDADPKKALLERQRIEEFYRPGLRQEVERYRESHEARVRACTGLDTLQATRLLLRWYDRLTPAFHTELVTPEIAARELGLPLDGARALWKASGQSTLTILAAGQPVGRTRFEQTLRFTFDPHPILKKAG